MDQIHVRGGSKRWHNWFNRMAVIRRNQSMHYEEGSNKNVTKSCFEALAQIDSKFALHNASGKNKSIEIMDMLGWYDYESYIATMEDLLNDYNNGQLCVKKLGVVNRTVQRIPLED
ncbi:hypothetical protein BpOF4_03685 [Alkalihalophilus pseudofirmus OF4]|uniref:Uncharacterized protein n=1 Tax=Alkalihalophilus pseudofirmus (strain ATCC BAA-2126 / JCM 17055 / OF4) TaxID=398511 RepID=D3FX48_ALKPO|nr:hypothetical protein [Alkalihalophilus pseudofirmus]ADC48803.1 hypothetical protein BpOF4_03685 [Alkalihalophilus pseudofirmus OF4]